jgi:hypothetical protein
MKLNKSSHLYASFQSFMRLRSIGFLAIFICIHQSALAQGDAAPDFMRSIGKIYVVAAVCLIILITILIYLIALDRKITRLEKRQKNEY